MTSPLILTRSQVRSVDEIAVTEFEIPSLILMENAGRSCALALLKLGIPPAGIVTICCGKGNNGGDGLVMARHLANAGVMVEVQLFHSPEELSPDSHANYRMLTHSDVPIHIVKMPEQQAELSEKLQRSAWIVDALLGTGATGKLRPPYSDLIPAMNSAARPIFAIDIPSGLDCDSGRLEEAAIIAQATMTLVALKPAFLTEVGRKHCGEVLIGEIGIPQSLLCRF